MSERLVGGMFGLAELAYKSDAQAPFLNGNELFLINARSAIKIIVDFLNPGRVWLPSFLCDAMLEAIPHSRVRFYGVDDGLRVSVQWLSDLQKGDLVIFIDYFGFLFESTLAKSIKERGCWVLEDASQALFSTQVGMYSDFVIFSPRKFLGVPDGGILRNNTEIDFSLFELQSPPSEWWLKSLRSTILRREFDSQGGERIWFELFREVEGKAPVGLFEMSELSRTLLKHCFDYRSMIQKRLENYRMLDSYLNKVALFSELPAHTVPLGFPIQVRNRDHVRQKLFERNIYPPVHWPIADVVPSEFVGSHVLSRNILTLICDHRYDTDDMQITAEIVLREAQND